MRWLALAAVFLIGAGGPDSGPPVGSKPEPLPVFVTVGEHGGEAVDLTADRQGRPTLYVFIQADRWDRPLARFVRDLDRKLGGNEVVDGVEMTLVWLTDDAPAARQYQPRGQTSLKLARTRWAVFEGGKFGPNGWAINPDAFATAVAVRDGQVAGREGFISVGEAESARVLKWLAKP